MNVSPHPKLLGIAASLRNARWGAGNEQLTCALRRIGSEIELQSFLERESELHLQNFIDSGREQRLDFFQIHDNLRRLSGDSGLSNSEVALAAALWEAQTMGCEIEHLSLSEYFLPNGAAKNLDRLKEKLREADGLLVSGPVYFGDRGSLAESLINLLRTDGKLRSAMRGKF